MGRLTLALIFLLTGCAITDEERAERYAHLNHIEREFHSLEQDCDLLDGVMYIPRRRVPNGIPTPWEMKDSVCIWQDDYGRLVTEKIYLD